MSKFNIPSLEEMLKSGVHFGHKTSRWHPRMGRYIFGIRRGIHIVNLEKTQEQLEHALEYIKGAVARGGTVLFVGTKPQAKPFVAQFAKACGMPYVSERWLGGTLTNFGQIGKAVKELKRLKEQRDKGELRKYTKKEQLMIERDIEDMERKFGGIANMDKVPEALFVVDVVHERTAVREARVVGAKVVGLCDTNVNPAGVDYIVPGNDDAVKSVELMTRLVADAVSAGKAAPVADDKKQEEPTQKQEEKEGQKEAGKETAQEATGASV